ncbi:hypothetical protein [Streptomyces sp. NPDC058657]|uniref:hypothetical protein n=1 Tax=unclassified Streptomyces TaxID=2593676 RepID=UPI0036606F33
MPLTERDFAGATELLDVIRKLTRRKRFLERTPENEVRGERPLPLVCLIRDQGPNGFLGDLGERWRASESRHRAPHCYLDAGATTAGNGAGESGPAHTPDGGSRRPEQPSRPDRGLRPEQPSRPDQALRPEQPEPPPPPEPLLPLLNRLATALGNDTRSPTRPFRFGFYRLAAWLTTEDLSEAARQGEKDREVGELLRGRGAGAHQLDPGVVADTVNASPPPLNFVASLLRLFAEVGRLLGLRRTGLAQEARWFMRQPFMAPHSTTFRGLASRLTLDNRDSEDLAEIKKLLVHAFLEDLRRTYRRSRRRVFPRRAGWRRTAYLTVLLDNVTEENGGWELLRLITQVRNVTGDLDPLLVVAAGDERPAMLEAGEGGALHPATEARTALEDWEDHLPRKRQQLADSARYVWIALPPAQSAAAPSRGRRTAAFEAPAPPVLSRRGVGEALAAGLLALALLPVTLSVADEWGADCTYFRDALYEGVSVRTAELAPGVRQCIGYSDNEVQVFGVNKRLVKAQRALFEQNRKAAEKHRERPERPYVTLVHFVGLTHHKDDPDTDHAAAEELEGMLLRQRAQNDIKSLGEPLLRVVVANGGDGMRQAPQVVREMLRPLFEEDPSVMAVVGLDRTVRETKEAITEIGLAGVPTISTTLTGTGLGTLSPLYFQMVPDNTVQARLIAEYALHRGAGKVELHHPEQADEYVSTLLGATRKELARLKIPQGDAPWKGRADGVPSLCAGNRDRRQEMVFYIGREGAFGEFMRAATKGCTDLADLPLIVAADAVSRFVAQGNRLADPDLAGRPMSYVGMGSLVTLAGKSCAEKGEPAAALGKGDSLQSFCAGYRELRDELEAEFPPEKDGTSEGPTTPWPAERTGMAYDVAELVVHTVSEVRKQLESQHRPASPHRAAVAQQLRDTTFQGATGPVDFGTSRIGNERILAVLRIDSISALKDSPACDFLLGDLPGKLRPDPRTHCPV